jgi:hypothetical protein
MNMRYIRMLLTTLALGTASGVVFAQKGKLGIVPKEGFVPDAATAKAIAEAVLTPVLGKEMVASERPFRATLRKDIWIVMGSVSCEGAPAGAHCPGGSAEVHIRRRDGSVILMTHGQ